MRDIAFLDARRGSRLACDSPKPVRKLAELFSTGQDQCGAAERLAHPLISFPVHLGPNWRIVDDPLQWILQRRKGNARLIPARFCVFRKLTGQGGIFR
jgi:hypothetical protein